MTSQPNPFARLPRAARTCAVLALVAGAPALAAPGADGAERLAALDAAAPPTMAKEAELGLRPAAVVPAAPESERVAPLERMPAYVPGTGSIPEIPLPRTIGAEALVGPMLAGRLAGLAADDLALRHGAEDLAAFQAFYAARENAPLWLDLSTGAVAWTDAARAVVAILRDAAAEGLDPAAYPVPALPAGPAIDAAAVAQAEVELSAALVRYAQHARGGRLQPSRLHELITPTLDVPAADAVLAALAAAEDPAATLAAYQPRHEGYVHLRAALAALRAAGETPEPLVRVPPGRVLKVGMRDDRVPLLRARFGMEPPADTEAQVYDVALAGAVEDFQREHGLAVDGIVGNQTIAALASLDPARRDGDLIANMERWRWLPEALGARAVFVNVPGYRMELLDDGEIVHEARVIVGKPGQETPIFSDVMEYVVVSPTWTVPPTIMRKDFLPGLRADPNYAAARGFDMIQNGGNITVRQPPGPRNALGHIKFMFPNGHHVYLHDTPSRGLFDTLRRAYSYGCVRVENPFKLADFLLAEQGWPEARLRALIGPRERYVHLDEPVPVHLAYFTLEADADGRIVPHEDIYGFDTLTREALGLDP